MDDFPFLSKYAYGNGKTDSVNPIFAALHMQLPRIAELLHIPVEKLKIYDFLHFPRNYLETEHRDPVVSLHGLFDGLPPVQKKRKQWPGIDGIHGIQIRKSRLDPSLRYALYCTRNGNVNEQFLIIEQGKIFRLRRYAARLNRLQGTNCDKPILEPGVIDDVIKNSIGFLLKARQIKKYGVRIRRGIILDGPPGNGKTMLCRYIQKMCSRHGIDWETITASDIEEAFSGKYLDELFTRSTVTFFDDVDISYMDRTKGNSKMACAMLTAMDGISEKDNHVVRIFTTNEHVNALDPAFTRPGRIDKCITLEKPSAELRKRLVLEVWPKDIQEVLGDIDEFVDRCEDYSFAELEAIRTILVTNKFSGDGCWDIERAFDEFVGGKASNKNRKAKPKVGF